MTDDSSQTPRYRPPNRPYLGDFPPWYVVLAGVLLVAILSLLVYLVGRGDDGQIQTTGPTSATSTPTLPSTDSSTTTSADPSSTTSSTVSSTTASTAPSTTSTAASSTTSSTVSTTTTAPSTTTTVDPVLYRSAVWPWVDRTVRYDDPVDAARGFALDFLGFEDPVVGPFYQGDSRSGEVAVQPEADGPDTTVFVRQLGPGNTWWVLGAATANIVIDEPDALDVIDTPLRVAGMALAFEGMVDVELRADGSTTPLFEGVVQGGATELLPFESTFTWTTTGRGAGALVLLTHSMEDGQLWEAAVVRVEFAGG